MKVMGDKFVDENSDCGCDALAGDSYGLRTL